MIIVCVRWWLVHSTLSLNVCLLFTIIFYYADKEPVPLLDNQQQVKTSRYILSTVMCVYSVHVIGTYPFGNYFTLSIRIERLRCTIHLYTSRNVSGNRHISKLNLLWTWITLIWTRWTELIIFNTHISYLK